MFVQSVQIIEGGYVQSVSKKSGSFTQPGGSVPHPSPHSLHHSLGELRTINDSVRERGCTCVEDAQSVMGRGCRPHSSVHLPLPPRVHSRRTSTFIHTLTRIHTCHILSPTVTHASTNHPSTLTLCHMPHIYTTARHPLPPSRPHPAT